MVAHPGDYIWSSYRANAHGESSTLLTPHPVYEALDTDAGARRGAYRELFRYQLDPGLVDQIRTATNGNYALGTEEFQAQIALALGRRVTPARPGRPRNRKEPRSQDMFKSS